MQRISFKKAFLFMLLASLMIAGSAFALTGDLDTTFNGTGYNADSDSIYGNKTIVLTDGRIVTVGASNDDDVVIIRYFAD